VPGMEALIVIAKHKWMIGGLVFVVGVASVLYALLAPKLYLANTKIMPPQPVQSLATSLMGDLAPLASLAGRDFGIRNPNDLYVSLLQTRSVEEKLVQRFKLMDLYGAKRMMDARRRLHDSTEIVAAKDGIISISVLDRDPRRAADLANAYVVELENLTHSLALTEAAQRRLFFENQMASANDQLAKAEQDLKAVQESTGVIQLDAQAKAMIDAIARLRAQVAAKEVERRSMQVFATAQNPDLVRAGQELSQLREQLAALERRQGGPDGNLEVSVSKLPSAGLEYVRRLRMVKYYEAVFEILAKQYEAAKMDEGRSGAVIQVIDKAAPPEERARPKRTIIVLKYTGLALLVGIIAAFVREALQGARANARTAATLALLRTYVLEPPRWWRRRMR